MDRYDYQPGRKVSPSAFHVKSIKGRWVVFGPYGQFARSFTSRGEADAEAKAGREHFERQERQASGEVDDLAAAGPVSGPADDPDLSPMAFEVAHFGDASGGYGVFNEKGGIERTFAKKDEADRHAAAIKAAYRARSQSPAAGSPSPAAPSSGGSTQAAAPQANRAFDTFRRAYDGFRSAAAQAARFATNPMAAAASAARGWGTASFNPAAPSGTGGGGGSNSSSSGLGGISGAFERAFDASIGKAIQGAEKIVTGSLDTFRRAYAGFKSMAANPMGVASNVASAASRAAFGASVVAAFAAARAKGFVGGVAGAAIGAFGTRAGRARIRRRVRRSSAQVARAAARVARRAGRGIASAASGIGSAAKGLIGAASGELPGLAAAALTSIPRMLHALAEDQLGQNRRLVPFSGQIGAGFARLDLGDQYRDIRLARSAEGTASTLARQINGIRENLSGLDQLTLGVGNRLGIAAAAFISPGLREIGKLAGGANNAMNKADPMGTAVEDAVNKMHEYFGYATGFLGGFFANPLAPDLAGGKALADATAADIRRQQAADKLAGQRGETDAWARAMDNAMNLPPVRPARPLRP